MIHIPVISSNIKSVAHEGEVMEVVYNHGGTYRFPGVDKDQFNSLLAAQSIGKSLNALGVKGIKVELDKKQEGQ
jgi:hypothetical protein